MPTKDVYKQLLFAGPRLSTDKSSVDYMVMVSVFCMNNSAVRTLASKHFGFLFLLLHLAPFDGMAMLCLLI